MLCVLNKEEFPNKYFYQYDIFADKFTRKVLK